MKLILLISGIVVVALNVILWYWKKHGGVAKADKTTDNIENTNGYGIDSAEFLNSPEAVALKEEAAAELGIAVEQLNEMSPDEIVVLAAEKGLIQAR